jgi:uncharacterized protein (TIGR02118 family)
MIKVSVFYPHQPGSHFDINYYCERHMPMVRRLLGTAVKNTAVEQGLSGRSPGVPPPYMAMGHMYFESVPAFVEAWTPHAAQILGDIPNYTNVQHQVQISEVKL